MPTTPNFNLDADEAPRALVKLRDTDGRVWTAALILSPLVAEDNPTAKRDLVPGESMSLLSFSVVTP